MKASDNNLAATVELLFKESCTKYGVPKMVRGDRGVENVGVRDYMRDLCGQKGFIAGKSCHNQRNERLWRDVYGRVVEFYHDLFQEMEEKEILNIDTDLEILIQGIYFYVYNCSFFAAD